MCPVLFQPLCRRRGAAKAAGYKCLTPSNKKQFLEYLSEDDIEHGTLAGIGYFEEFSTNDKLVFTSQVCVPGMDGGTYLRLELFPKDWKLKIRRDETTDIEVTPLKEDEGV